MHSRISTFALIAGLMLAAMPYVAGADVPSIAQLDAQSRAAGNRKDLAVQIGHTIFATKWPAQVTQVSANAVDGHVVLGLRVSGVKFHAPLTRAGFVNEVVELITQAFAADESAEEVDLWASVPIAVGKGVIVSGDLAKPTSREVFTLSAKRGEAPKELAARVTGGPGVFWDEDWMRTAFNQRT